MNFKDWSKTCILGRHRSAKGTGAQSEMIRQLDSDVFPCSHFSCLSTLEQCFDFLLKSKNMLSYVRAAKPVLHSMTLLNHGDFNLARIGSFKRAHAVIL